jgi:hypothetical protein
MTDRVRRIACGVVLFTSAAAFTPATATVTFVQAGAYSQTTAGIGGPAEIKNGPNDESTGIGDGFFSSHSDSREDAMVSQVLTSAAGAIQFDGPASASFFVRSSSIADSLSAVAVPHGSATGRTLYYFSIDTDSTLSFTAFASPDNPGPAANISIDLFSVGTIGMPGTFYQRGYFAGDGTAAYDLAPGFYGFEVGAFSQATSFGSRVTTGSVANVSLSIDSPPPTSGVPEPGSWAMMVGGFALIGSITRRSKRASSRAPLNAESDRLPVPRQRELRFFFVQGIQS